MSAPSGPTTTALPSASACAVTPVSGDDRVGVVEQPLRPPTRGACRLRSTGVPSDQVTPSLIVYVIVSGSSESTVHVPNWSLLM
jgi:hypothetical protein